jgi:hypothetical protein
MEQALRAQEVPDPGAEDEVGDEVHLDHLRGRAAGGRAGASIDRDDVDDARRFGREEGIRDLVVTHPIGGGIGRGRDRTIRKTL